MSAPWRLNSCSSSAMTSYSMRPGRQKRIAAHMRAGGDLARAAHEADFAAALEQAHVVQHVIERHELLRRMHAAARLRAQRVDPADHALIELLVQAHGVEHARATSRAARAGSRRYRRSEKHRRRRSARPRRPARRACRPRSRARGCARARTAHIRPASRPGISTATASGSLKAGQVIEVAVLAVVVLDVVVALAHRGRRHDGDGVAARSGA